MGAKDFTSARRRHIIESWERRTSLQHAGGILLNRGSEGLHFSTPEASLNHGSE